MGELILDAAHLKVKEKDILGNETVKAKVIRSVKVYHGLALDGIEFCHEDGSSQLFGARGGKPGGDEFVLDTRIGETIAGFYIRAGAWIDGLQIITTMTGRKSPIYGDATGGSGHTLIPPTGYRVMGISGSFGQWVDSFQQHCRTINLLNVSWTCGPNSPLPRTTSPFRSLSAASAYHFHLCFPPLDIPKSPM